MRTLTKQVSDWTRVGLLNKSLQKDVFQGGAQNWEELIIELQELAILAQPDEYRVAMCMPKVWVLNLVQPFN